MPTRASVPPPVQPLAWIDTHCHLDAYANTRACIEVRHQAAQQGVVHCVIPAVEVAQFDAVRALAHQTNDSYCLGIHPLYTPQASNADLAQLDAHLRQHQHDPRLVAVGEIGLDFFVPALCSPAMREKQEYFYQAQLLLARQYNLPVVLHVRRSADRLLKYLRALSPNGATTSQPPWKGIAHAFNGSDVQAQAFLRMGLKLGFGGAMTFPRALQLRHLAQTLPLEALVLETDAPDMPPQWLYTTAQARAQGQPNRPNHPSELPRIATEIAALRALPSAALARATWHNACTALPKLAGLLH